MSRPIATNTTVDQTDLIEFIETRHRAVLVTTRADGSPQVSPVTAGYDDGAIVIAVLNVTSVDSPSDGGDGFDLNKPMLQWAQSTDRYLNITCETDEVLIFYMEE